MKERRILFVGAVIVTLTVTVPAAIAEPQRLQVDTYATNTGLTTYRRAPDGISFKSKKLPAWTLHVQQQYSTFVTPQPFAGNPDYIQSLEVSAMRALPARFPQHLFASFKASSYNANDYLDWILLPSEAGMAATFGWRIGELHHRLNMSVEVEHRELGQDKKITSLILDVHYYF